MEPAVRKISLADKTGGPVWSLANIREQSDFYDLTLISSEGDLFPAHRVILAVTSSYLQSRIKKSSEANQVISLKSVNSEVLSALLNFIYDGKAVISEAEAESFVDTAKKWKIKQFLSIRRKRTPVKPAEIIGDLSNLTKKDIDGSSRCFCGFKNQHESRVLAHAHKHVPELGFTCEVCQHLARTKASLYKHRRKHV